MTSSQKKKSLPPLPLFRAPGLCGAGFKRKQDLIGGAYLWNEDVKRPALLEEILSIHGIPAFGADQSKIILCPFLSHVESMTYNVATKLAGNAINIPAIGEFIMWFLSRLHPHKRAFAKPLASLSSVIVLSDSDDE